MAEDHDWHLFNEDGQLEVARIAGRYLIRRVGTDEVLLNLTADEWNSYREGAPDGETEG